MNNNYQRWVGSFNDYKNGKLVGTALFLPAAGLREPAFGQIGKRDFEGNYWSSTQYSSYAAFNLSFDETTIVINKTFYTTKLFAYPIRCVEE